MTLAEGVAGSERAFVRLMNRRARQLGLTQHALRATRSGSTSRAPTRSARDLVTLATLLRTKPFFRRTVNKETRRRSRPATTRARSTTATTSCAPSAWVNGVKTGHTRGAGYVLVGSGRRNGIQVVSAVLGTPSEARARRRLARAADLRPPRASSASPPRPRARSVGISVPIRYRRGAELELVIGPQRPAHRGAATAQRDRVTVEPTRWPSEVEGPIAAGHGARRGRRAAGRPQDRDRPARGRRGRRRRPIWRSAPSPGSPARSRSCSPSPSWAVRCCWHGGGGDPADRAPGGHARRPGPHDHHGHPQHGHRQDALRAELPARAPPPHGGADDDAGRQGRQRRARAQDARRAGDRHRA